MADGFLLLVCFVLRCFTHAYPLLLLLLLPTHPSSIYLLFLSILHYRYPSFLPFISPLYSISISIFFSISIPTPSTGYDDRTWNQILPKPTSPNNRPSFPYTTSTDTPIHPSQIPASAHQNLKRPISCVSHPLSFTHRAIAVPGRCVARVEWKQARCGGKECCLGFWYREGEIGEGL